MAHSTVVAAVEARLDELWSRCPVLDENSLGETPHDGSPFLMLQFPFSTSERVSFGDPGNNVYRESGAFRLVLQTERGSGAVTGRQWADELADMFRGKHFGGVETFAPSSASSDDTNENGNYYTLAVAVPYRFDFLG